MTNYGLIFLSIILLLCQTCLSSEEALKNRELKYSFADSLTNELTEISKTGYMNGFGVAIVNQLQTVYQMGFGYADKRLNAKYSIHTVQNIASVSKTLIGIALLKAQEMGKLNLDDDINLFLPFKVINPYHPQAIITLRHLATHTSTIKDTDFYASKSYILVDDWFGANANLKLDVTLNSPSTHLSMLDFLKNVLLESGDWYKKEGFLSNKPGTMFEYSNVGATLAALILEIATGESYTSFTTKYILRPLNMSSTGWSFGTIDRSRHTKLYSKMKAEIPFYRLITFPDGGLLTSVNDLSKYLNELIKGYSGEGKLLGSDSYRQLFTPQLTPLNFTGSPVENCGIFIKITPDGLIGHDGQDPGVNTGMYFNPATKIGAILFVNTDLDSEGEKQYRSILKILEKYEHILGNQKNE